MDRTALSTGALKLHAKMPRKLNDDVTHSHLRNLMNHNIIHY